MEEDSSHSKNGMVNHGFTVEFSSEEESMSDVDVSYSSFTPRPSNFDGATKGELRATEADILTTTVANKPKHSLSDESDSNQHRKKSNDSDVAAGSKRQSLSSSNALPLPTTTESEQQHNQRNSVDKNVQVDSMLPTSVPQAEAASLIPNGRKLSSEINNRKSSASDHNNDVKNDSSARQSKEYFRDVRLSLDASKPISTSVDGSNVLPFHNSINNGSNNNIRRKSQTSRNSESCDSCVLKAIEQYKILFKYLVQRPLFCFSIWVMFYVFWGDDALPGGSLFALTVLELTALFLGYIAELIQLPGLLGMAAAGLILRNVPYIDVAKDLESSVSSPLRALSIVILLIRGALGVNPVNIAKFRKNIPPLVIGSCVVEAIAVSLAVHFILDFPVEWAALMGCIISAMSGVAVLPYLAITEKSLSSKADRCSLSPNYQTVITLARTSCGLDAMLAICMAEVALGFIFSEGDVGQGVLKGAVEVIYGGLFGILWGLLAGFLIDSTISNEKRTLTIFSCSVMSFMGFPKIGYPRAAPLAVFAGVLITSTIWKKRQIGGTNNEQLSAHYAILWYMFQPLLFSIIAARTDFDQVNWTVVWKGLVCIAIGLMIRFITTFSMTTVVGKLSLKERLYMCIAWMPKGTVQAALGPAALDTALGIKNLKHPDEYEDLGYKVMHISLVSFVSAALLGCLCLRFVGPRLLAQK